MEAETPTKPRRHEIWVAIGLSLIATLAFYFSTNSTLRDLDYTAEIASAFLRATSGFEKSRPSGSMR